VPRDGLGMKRLLATLLWVPLVAITALVAMIGSVFILASGMMIPLVRWLARVGDEE
jgi:hypothetical protein